MKENKKKEDNKPGFLIGIFFLISSGLFAFYVSSENHLNLEGGQSDFSSIAKTNQLDHINDHLKTTTDKMELERLKALVQNMKVASDSPSTSFSNTQIQTEEPIVLFDQDPRDRRLAEDLGRTNLIKKEPNDPRSQVYNSVIADRQAQKIKEEDRKRLARDFVANARKDGWIVKLDDNFQIKSYRRVDEYDEAREQETDYRGYSVIPK